MSKGKFANTKPEKKAIPTAVTIALAVALVIMIVILVIQSQSASKNAAGLQTQIDTLTTQNQQLTTISDQAKAEITRLQEALVAITDNSEYMEGQAVIENNNTTLTTKLKASTEVINALNAMLTYNEETLKIHLQTIQDEELYNHMDEDVLNAYYMVMEYMEQPYWFNQENE